MNFLDKHIHLISLALFVVAYFLFYPDILLITDEQSYFNLALSIINGESGTLTHAEFLTPFSSDLVEGKYTLGTSLVLIPFIWLFGNMAVFIMPIFCFIASYRLSHKILKKLGYGNLGLVLFFIYLPLLFIIRSVMSEMPSLLIFTLGLFMYIKYLDDKKAAIYIFFLAGLSFLFRETNVLLFLPMLLSIFFGVHLLEKVKLGFTFLAGVGFRLIAHGYFFNEALHLKHGYPFGLHFMDDNIFVYLIILMLLYPLGILFLVIYKGKSRWVLMSTVVLFTLFHLIYGYNATVYSGMKMGLILNGRFFILLLPIFVIFLSFSLKRIKFLDSKNLRISAFLICLSIGIISQSYLSRISNHHSIIADRISTKYQDAPLVFDHQFRTSIRRYINPFFNNQNNSLEISRLENDEILNQLFQKTQKAYIISSERIGNKRKNNNRAKALKWIDDLDDKYKVVLVEKLLTGDGGEVNIYELTASLE